MYFGLCTLQILFELQESLVKTAAGNRANLLAAIN